MIFSQREIVLVPFPFSDLSTYKRRPVLIISNNDYNAKHSDVVVLAITSKLYQDEYSVEIDDNSLDFGILPEKSVIKIAKIFSISKNSILKKFSILSVDTFKEVEIKLIQLFSNLDNSP